MIISNIILKAVTSLNAVDAFLSIKLMSNVKRNPLYQVRTQHVIIFIFKVKLIFLFLCKCRSIRKQFATKKLLRRLEQTVSRKKIQESNYFLNIIINLVMIYINFVWYQYELQNSALFDTILVQVGEIVIHAKVGR